MTDAGSTPTRLRTGPGVGSGWPPCAGCANSRARPGARHHQLHRSGRRPARGPRRAAGYVYKDIDPPALAAAIRAVHAGHVLLNPGVAALLAAGDATPPVGRLTPRERVVLAEVARGRSNREIARSLALSEKTVKTHVSSVLAKLGVQDRTQAALFAVRTGLAAGQDPAEDASPR
jgi:DNA-binding CsgD family transcriptional regulator